MLAALLMLAAAPAYDPAHGQPQCRYATTIEFPVDRSSFRLVQEFGALSARHQGRAHTGEDWYAGEGGGPHVVRAIADGRVTFSSPNGWGSDGGVIIVEHTFPDNSIAYSMYGHLSEAGGVAFPAAFTCVRAGDVLATIGDVRPAPHLHFEIRTSNPSTPGAGYVWGPPEAQGLRRPSKFILNWQTWLLDAFRWRMDIADEAGPVAPPVQLDDLSLLLLDAGRVLRGSPDGRVLWRVNLPRPAVGLLPFRDGALIAYADGSMQPVGRDGALGERWQSAAPALEGAPITAWGIWLFRTPDDDLLAFDPALRSVLWRLGGVPAILRWSATEAVLGLITRDLQMLLIAPDGRLIDRALLREAGALAPAPDGGLLAYTRGGLWSIAPDGTWSLASTAAPPGGGGAAVLPAPDGGIFAFDGQALTAYDAGGLPRWRAELDGFNDDLAVGTAQQLALHGSILLLTGNGGQIAAVQAETGAICRQARIYGSWRAGAWHSLDADGLLRVYVADQVIGLNWRQFLGLCAP